MAAVNMQEDSMRKLDTAREASIDLVALNNTVVNTRKVVKASKVQVIHKLSRMIKKLKTKKGSEQQKEKNLRKAQRMLDEILAIKELNEDSVTKFALANKTTFGDVCKQSSVTAKARGLLRLAEHRLMADTVTSFRKQHSDWEELAEFLLTKRTGRRFKTKAQKERAARKNVEKDVTLSAERTDGVSRSRRVGDGDKTGGGGDDVNSERSGSDDDDDGDKAGGGDDVNSVNSDSDDDGSDSEGGDDDDVNSDNDSDDDGGDDDVSSEHSASDVDDSVDEDDGVRQNLADVPSSEEEDDSVDEDNSTNAAPPRNFARVSKNRGTANSASDSDSDDVVSSTQSFSDVEQDDDVDESDSDDIDGDSDDENLNARSTQHDDRLGSDDGEETESRSMSKALSLLTQAPAKSTLVEDPFFTSDPSADTAKPHHWIEEDAVKKIETVSGYERGGYSSRGGGWRGRDSRGGGGGRDWGDSRGGGRDWRDSRGRDRDSWGRGRDSWGRGRDSWGGGRDSRGGGRGQRSSRGGGSWSQPEDDRWLRGDGEQREGGRGRGRGRGRGGQPRGRGAFSSRDDFSQKRGTKRKTDHRSGVGKNDGPPSKKKFESFRKTQEPAARKMEAAAPKAESAPSHPSWQAHRQQKMKEKNATFSGKHVKFDD